MGFAPLFCWLSTRRPRAGAGSPICASAPCHETWATGVRSDEQARPAFLSVPSSVQCYASEAVRKLRWSEETAGSKHRESERDHSAVVIDSALP
jgi:hypothetical protein